MTSIRERNIGVLQYLNDYGVPFDLIAWIILSISDEIFDPSVFASSGKLQEVK